MCIRPNRLDDGVEVACRECWQCRKRRVDDLIGRCIAESKYSKKTYAITLTYAQDAGVNAVTLVYKNVQDFLKRLRKKYKCRYIVAGEYGSAKGRAHWHIIVFFKDNVPDVQENKRVEWKYWPHGFSYFQYPDWKGFEYVLKYVLKDQDSRSADAHLAMSKKDMQWCEQSQKMKMQGAPLGYQYFNWLADEHVRQGLAPQSYFYKFGGIRDYKNREKTFMMTGKTKENFMERFLQKWMEKYEADPRSEIVDEYLDYVTEIEYTDAELMLRLHDKSVRYVEAPLDVVAPQNEAVLHEFEYRGIPVAAWESKDKFHIITENDQWHEERAEIINHIKTKSKKIRSRTESEILRAHWDGE